MLWHTSIALVSKVLVTWTLRLGEKGKEDKKLQQVRRKSSWSLLRSPHIQQRNRYLEKQEINVPTESLNTFTQLLAHSLGSWHLGGEWIFIA